MSNDEFDIEEDDDEKGEPFRSGFVAILGRPNVGKSTLVNALVEAKVAITSPTPNTTRTAIRGVLHGDNYQAIFVDTPGIHKPRTELGTKLNDVASRMVGDVDTCMLVIDASKSIGPGDRFVAQKLPKDRIIVVNKVDRVNPTALLEQLAAAAEEFGTDQTEYFPVSARSGDGIAALREYLVARLPVGPHYFPEDMLSDLPDPFFVAELVREQLLKAAKEELPHSIACIVTEWEWPYICCEIIVERESQKPIVIGKGGLNLKAAGMAARRQMPEGVYLDLKVRVERDWQRRPDMIERFGY